VVGVYLRPFFREGNALRLDFRLVALLGVQGLLLARDAEPAQHACDGRDVTTDAQAVAQFREGGVGLLANEGAESPDGNPVELGSRSTAVRLGLDGPGGPPSLQEPDHEARADEDGEPAHEGSQEGPRHEHGHNSCRRGHALAAAETQVDGEQVSQERRHPHADGQGPRRQPRAGLCQAQPREHRHRPLGAVEDEDDDAPAPSQHPADVGGTDVAAAVAQDVHAASAGHQVAKGDGPD
jgi:hypothetical protein